MNSKMKALIASAFLSVVILSKSVQAEDKKAEPSKGAAVSEQKAADDHGGSCMGKEGCDGGSCKGMMGKKHHKGGKHTCNHECSGKHGEKHGDKHDHDADEHDHDSKDAKDSKDTKMDSKKKSK